MRMHGWPLLAAVFFAVVFYGAPALAQFPPTVDTVPANSSPPLPPDTKVTCTPNPNTGAPSPTCPILRMNGFSYWALSYRDNRVAFAIAAYDSNGRVVRLWERPGARYVWNITVDENKETVTFMGQAGGNLVMSWQELGVAVLPGALALANVNAQAVNCLFVANCGSITPTNSTAAISGPTTTGNAFLQTRTFVGASGTPAAGKTAYEYRVDLTQAVSNDEAPCVTGVSVDIGPIVQFNYDGTGTVDDVWIITQGGTGKVGLYSAIKTGNIVDFTFQQPICAGATSGTGLSSQFFGVTSASAPKSVTAKLGWAGTIGLDVPARAPGY